MGSRRPLVLHMGFRHENRWTEQAGLWYETPEEIAAGHAWGLRKAALLRWVKRHGFRRLTARERRCIELHFFEGMTYREAGSATRTSASSVNRAVHRGLAKLKVAARRDFDLEELGGLPRHGKVLSVLRGPR